MMVYTHTHTPVQTIAPGVDCMISYDDCDVGDMRAMVSLIIMVIMAV